MKTGDKEEQSKPSREELQKQLQAAEHAEIEACLRQLHALAESLGFEIVGVPGLTGDGRIVADWGVRRR